MHPAILLSALATMLAGSAMAVQGTANGVLTGIIGSGVLAATVSFLGGTLVMIIVMLVSARARRGLADAVQLVRTRQFPWWMTLGGIAGACVVIAQSLTVPLFGVAVFTMSFVSGQLVGALVVDNTSLPPSGRTPPTVTRVLGVCVVIGAVVFSAVGVAEYGISWWAPILPFAAGTLTALQQAFNGRLKLRTASAAAATFANFLVGSAFLVLCSLILLATGARLSGFPQLPGEAWTLIGGGLGVLFIGITTITVEYLGVLLLSLVALFGNLLGALVLDLAYPTAEAPVTWTTYVSMGIVLAGVVIASLPRRRH